jgi:Calx-beta domain
MKRAAAVLAFVLATSVHAATFTVSSPADSGLGSLRQAILDANLIPGTDQIVFTTPTVVATSAMPAITGVVAIDGSVGGGRVDIQGVFVSFASAFRFGAGSAGSTLTSVSVRTYHQPLAIETDSVTVSDSAFENNSYVGGNGNTIGPDNTFAELDVFGSNNVVEGNRIGRAKIVGGSNNRIGSVGNGNTIGPDGLTLPPYFASVIVVSAGYAFIEGNEIASDWPAGIYLGQSLSGGGATITGNSVHGQTTGIDVTGSGTPGPFYAARILGNRIYDVDLPIDLRENAIPSTGPTPNDPAPDADDGGNHLQNYPVIASAIGTPAGLAVTGSLTSAPLTTYLVELFGNPASDPEARTPLTTFEVTTDGAGNAAFNQLLPIPAPPDNGALTATATNQTTNDTSEVSAPIVVDLSGQLSFDPVTYTVAETDGSVTLIVVRTGGTANTVMVSYTTNSGTATAPADYGTTAGTLTFGPGVTSQTITVPIVADLVGEPNETFTATLSGPTNGATLGAATATVTIEGNSGAATVPTASTWALLVLALGLVAVALLRT